MTSKKLVKTFVCEMLNNIKTNVASAQAVPKVIFWRLFGRCGTLKLVPIICRLSVCWHQNKLAP